eukprot:GHVH01015630.1.p1 GENE.GHVH01015630.1~~GHVH01015630.1.p1  ORF type:complete len:105 (-),score=5.51 GHVH01015630.1:6-320(-)
MKEYIHSCLTANSIQPSCKGKDNLIGESVKYLGTMISRGAIRVEFFFLNGRGPLILRGLGPLFPGREGRVTNQEIARSLLTRYQPKRRDQSVQEKVPVIINMKQ